MQILEVRDERESGRVRIYASGELDLATTPLLERCTRKHVQARAEAVEIDLREVGFIDSTGVRLLLTLAAEAQRDGWTLTILPSDAVRRIVSLLGLQNRLLSPHVHAVEPGPLSIPA
jgi:anti-sigma B factor antagonist